MTMRICCNSHSTKIAQFVTLALISIIWNMLIFPAPVSAAPQTRATEQRWTLNQQNADIREFISQIAAITGQSFVLDPRIKGGNTVSVISSRPMTKSQVYDIFLEVMNANGYAVIPKGDDNNTIVPNTIAKTSGSVITHKPPPGTIMTTQVIDLHSVSAIEVIPIIRPLIAQYGHAAASASGNAVVVSDHEDNVKRITELVRELDDASNNNYEVLALNHVWVGDIAGIIQETLGSSKEQLTGGVQVIADERSNRLIIKGNANKRERIRKLVKTLDREGIRDSSTRVIFLRHSTAKNLADMLNDASSTLTQDSSSPAKATNGSSSSSRRSSSRGGLGSGTFIRADETTNALIIIADPDTLKELESLVHQLDVRRSQVLIEAAIVEVSGNLNETLGLQWGFQGKNIISDTAAPASKVPSFVGASISPNSITFGSVLMQNSNFGVLVNALSSKSNINLMSTPSIMTLDNEASEFIVGQEVPFTTGSYQQNNTDSRNPFTTTERQPVGLTLKITPHIGEGNSLRLEIEQELSNLTTARASGGDPITSQRKLKTVVIVDNQETIVLGGILQDTMTTQTDKVPILGDIPLLGRLFTNKRDVAEKQNLMLFLKPTIVRDSNEVHGVTIGKYSSIRTIYDTPSGQPENTLPPHPSNLFDMTIRPAPTGKTPAPAENKLVTAPEQVLLPPPDLLPKAPPVRRRK